MYCKNCAREIQDGINCCPFCGAPVEPAAPTQAQQQYNQSADNQPYQSNAYGQQSQYSAPFEPNPGYGQGGANYQQGYGYSQNGTYNNAPYQYGQPGNGQERIAAQNVDTSRTLGILSIILGIILTPLAGWICGGIGLSKANKYLNTFGFGAPESANAQSAKKLNKIGIIISTVLCVLSIIIGIIIALVFLAGAGTVDDSGFYFEEGISLLISNLLMFM